MKKLISTLLFTLTLSLTFAQLEKGITDLFEERENRPGGIIGVFEGGKIEFQKAYGLTNLSANQEPVIICSPLFLLVQPVTNALFFLEMFSKEDLPM